MFTPVAGPEALHRFAGKRAALALQRAAAPILVTIDHVPARLAVGLDQAALDIDHRGGELDAGLHQAAVARRRRAQHK
jgi:hypothetical protein